LPKERTLPVPLHNAPTALIELVRLHKQGILQPNLVVGMPVGFVNAAEAKELLMASGLVYISVGGRKGGSAVAAATVNAIANLAAKQSKAPSAWRKAD
jgi:precorrin-8X/cobalt-precorrin-8 methylmutase